MGQNPAAAQEQADSISSPTEEEDREQSQVLLLNNFNPNADYYLQCLKAQNIPKMYGIV